MRTVATRTDMDELLAAIALTAEYEWDRKYLLYFHIDLLPREKWILVKDDPSFIDDQIRIKKYEDPGE